MGEGSWYNAKRACEDFVFVFDGWMLPSFVILSDFLNAYFVENNNTPLLPLWSMRRDEYGEIGETETFLLTTNGFVRCPKSQSAHYYAVRKF